MEKASKVSVVGQTVIAKIAGKVYTIPCHNKASAIATCNELRQGVNIKAILSWAR